MSVNQVCEDIIALTHQDFAEIELECVNQVMWYDQARPKLTQDVQRLGKHNQTTLDLVKRLQDHIKAAQPLIKSIKAQTTDD